MVVEDEPRAPQQDEWKGDQEQQVGRVAGLDDVDATPRGDPPG